MNDLNKREILADYDDEGVYVYQAFSDFTGQNAIKHNAFVRGLGFNRGGRMSWIKPSLAWALYRSGFATKDRQTVLLRIKICHEGFIEILNNCVLSEFQETISHPDKKHWQHLLDKYEGRVQWDPARDLSLNKLDHRAIQIGIKGTLIENYAERWIVSIEDVSCLAHKILNAIESQQPMPNVPVERVYPVSEELRKRLNFDGQISPISINS